MSMDNESNEPVKANTSLSLTHSGGLIKVYAAPVKVSAVSKTST